MKKHTHWLLIAGSLAFSSSLMANRIEFKDLMANKLTFFNGTGCYFFKGKPGQESKEYHRITGEFDYLQDNGFNLRIEVLAENGAPNNIFKARFSKDRDNPETDTILVKHCEIGFKLVDKENRAFKLYDMAPTASVTYKMRRHGTSSESRFVTAYLSLAYKTLDGHKSTVQFNPKQDNDDPATETEVLTPAFKPGCVNSLDLVLSMRLVMRGNPDDEDTSIRVKRFPREVTGKVKGC